MLLKVHKSCAVIRGHALFFTHFVHVPHSDFLHTLIFRLDLKLSLMDLNAARGQRSWFILTNVRLRPLYET
jgi:hypothetical protein